MAGDPNVAPSLARGGRKARKRTPTSDELRGIRKRATARGLKPTNGQVLKTWQRNVDRATKLPVPPGIAKKQLGLQSARTLAPGRIQQANTSPLAQSGAKPSSSVGRAGGIASGLTSRAPLVPPPPNKATTRKRQRYAS